MGRVEGGRVFDACGEGLCGVTAFLFVLSVRTPRLRTAEKQSRMLCDSLFKDDVGCASVTMTASVTVQNANIALWYPNASQRPLDEVRLFPMPQEADHFSDQRQNLAHLEAAGRFAARLAFVLSSSSSRASRSSSVTRLPGADLRLTEKLRAACIILADPV